MIWKVILGNRRAEVKTARAIVHELERSPTDTTMRVKTLIVQNRIRQLIVDLTARINNQKNIEDKKINKKGG